MKLDRGAPDFQTIRDRVRYDPDTGHFFALKAAGKRKAGQRLGYQDGLGYWKLFIKGKWVLAHRLAWAMMNGDVWPDGEIDHLNGIPSDNRIANLRVATRSQNVANGKFNSLNTSGYRGVTRVPRARGPDKYQASIRKNLHAHYLGMFDTPEEAHAAYVAAAKQLHGEFFASDANNVVVPRPESKPQQLTLDAL